MQKYFSEIATRVKVLYSIAEEARKKGLDPLSVVEIPLATKLSEKVTGLVSIKYPQVKSQAVEKRITELENQYGLLDPAVSLAIAEEIANEKFCKFQSKLEAIDAGIRVAMAYNTLGVVSSPLEGFTELKLKKTADGKDYFCTYFSGPIRSAGGTAAAFSVVVADYLRQKFGYAKYDAREREIKRAITEVNDYHERITNLQYLPSEKEIEIIAKNLPVQVNGEPSEDKEVSNYKDLERIETNFLRSGFCLVFAEGIAQKAAKLIKILKSLREKGFVLDGWDFLNDIIKLQKKDIAEKKPEPSSKYIADLVAGRPILTHPSRPGGFRLRYGRTRTSGFSAVAIHPATMILLNEFIALGTQLRTERPGKSAAVVSCDSIESSIVKLHDGSLFKVKNIEQAKKLRQDISEIVYLGDILISYGDFYNRNHVLMPCGYNEEYWYAELTEAAKKLNRQDAIKKINPCNVDIEKAELLSKEFKIPLHPAFIFYWSQITPEQFDELISWISAARIDGKIILPFETVEREKLANAKRTLELLGCEHIVTIENVVIPEIESKAFLMNLGIDIADANFSKKIEKIKEKIKDKKSVAEIVNFFSNYTVKEKAGTFIGARMGRPEKAKLRELTGSPDVLFPVGEAGGRMRSVQKACESSVKADFPIYYCDNCKAETIYFICENCNNQTQKMHYCPECDRVLNSESCHIHGKVVDFMTKRIEMQHYLNAAISKLNLQKAEMPPLIKGVRGTSSASHIPENLAKGILRAIFNLNVNKDGTIRYDATEIPITHFKAREIGTSIDKLKELGYAHDINNKELENEEQILEIKPHDVILPVCPDSLDEKADVLFSNIANFVDNLLVRFYGLRPFYNLRTNDDLIGHLVGCIAPHNSAAVVGRIIGFSKMQALLASPYFHAAMRRDCLGYDTYVPINKNGKWKIEKIGAFVEENNPNEKADNFGTLRKEMSNTYTWSNPSRSKLLEITKHQPKRMLKLFLEDGREISLTESHKVYIKGKKEKRAKDLKVGEKLIVSYKKDVKEQDIKEIFLPKIFQDRKDVMLRNIRDYLSKFEKLNKGDNFYQRDSYPILFVKKLLSRHKKTLYGLPPHVKIAIKRDNVSLPIKILLDKQLLEIIGLYIAEGFLRKNDSKKGFYQISIAGNREIRNLVKKIFYSHFNLQPSYENLAQVVFSSRLIYELFKDYLQTGDGAKNKRIPSLFLNLKKDKIACLLRGYFEGDGSVSLSDIRVTCDTISEGLKHDLSFVLSRFEIYTKFYEYEKEPGPRVREFYIKKNKPVPKFKITKIIIPSNFVKKFLDIGFISERKTNILNEICKKVPYGMKIDFDENYAYPKITKIEEIGEAISYCFNVTSAHNFFANDILIHNCDGDETAVMLLLDTLLNFSKEFLPSHRGGTQDAPLILNARLRVGEVDDMVFDMETAVKFPLEFYEAALNYKLPSMVKIPQVRDRLNEEDEAFSNLGYTHETSDINQGATCSAYKKLATMGEKVKGQMQLAEKIRAVETEDVAALVIERHLIRDIRGNLRKFSMQQFRCVKCNEKYRRPPLQGTCLKCSGKIIFTISEGGIIKYLEPALQLAQKYNVPEYIRQSLELTKKYIESMFGKETEKQEALQKWF